MKLKLYASGDGALHFVREGGSDPITEQEAIDYLAGNPDAEHLREKGWRIVKCNSWYVAVAPIRRLAANKIEYEGKVFRLVLAEDAIFIDRENNNAKRVIDSGMTLYFTIEEHPELGEIEMKNWSARAAIRHFLEHEEEITSQPWNPVPFVHAGAGI